MVLRYKDIHAFDNSKTIKLITVCTEQVRSPYIEHAASGLPNPTRLEWGGYDLSRLKTSRCYHTLSENRNRVFTHSLDVN